jgi:hypothetical protein
MSARFGSAYPPPFKLLFYPSCAGGGTKSGVPLPSGAKIVMIDYVSSATGS